MEGDREMCVCVSVSVCGGVTRVRVSRHSLVSLIAVSPRRRLVGDLSRGDGAESGFSWGGGGGGGGELQSSHDDSISMCQSLTLCTVVEPHERARVCVVRAETCKKKG